MTFLQQSSVQHKRKRYVLYTCILAVLLIVGIFIAHTIAFSLGGPLWAMRSNMVASTGQFGAYFLSKESLKNERDQLQNEVSQKEAEIFALRAQMDIYKSLDSYIALHEPQTEERVVKVVTRPPQTPFDELIARADTGIDLRSGEYVFFGKVPVGVIDTVDGVFVRIKLFSHVSSVMPIIIGQQKILAEASGRGSGVLKATVPRASGVALGDKVYTASSSIAFGTITHIDTEESQSFSDVYISLPISPLSVDWLTVVP